MIPVLAVFIPPVMVGNAGREEQQIVCTKQKGAIARFRARLAAQSQIDDVTFHPLRAVNVVVQL